MAPAAHAARAMRSLVIGIAVVTGLVAVVMILAVIVVVAVIFIISVVAPGTRISILNADDLGEFPRRVLKRGHQPPRDRLRGSLSCKLRLG